MTDEDEGPQYVAQSLKCRSCEARDLAAHDAARAAQDNGTFLAGWQWTTTPEVNNGG